MKQRAFFIILLTASCMSLTIWAMQQAPAAPAPAVPPPPSDPPAPFYAHVVASGLRGGYQVVAADGS